MICHHIGVIKIWWKQTQAIGYLYRQATVDVGLLRMDWNIYRPVDSIYTSFTSILQVRVRLIIWCFGWGYTYFYFILFIFWVGGGSATGIIFTFSLSFTTTGFLYNVTKCALRWRKHWQTIVNARGDIKSVMLQYVRWTITRSILSYF